FGWAIIASWLAPIRRSERTAPCLIIGVGRSLNTGLSTHPSRESWVWCAPATVACGLGWMGRGKTCLKRMGGRLPTTTTSTLLSLFLRVATTTSALVPLRGPMLRGCGMVRRKPEPFDILANAEKAAEVIGKVQP